MSQQNTESTDNRSDVWQPRRVKIKMWHVTDGDKS